MARPKNPWFRFYSEAMRDAKLRLRPLSDRWAWVGVMSVASESPERGYLIVNEEVMSIAALADLTALSLKEATSALSYFVQKGMVADDDRGVPFVTAWWERQYESDNSTERATRSRLKQQHADVANNVAEADVATESLSVSLLPLRSLEKAVLEDFEEFWRAYPRHESKDAAKKAYLKVRKRVDMQVILDGAVRYASDPNRDPAYTKHAATWLNQGCWDDDPLPARSSVGRRDPNHNQRTIERIVGEMSADLPILNMIEGSTS